MRSHRPVLILACLLPFLSAPYALAQDTNSDPGQAASQPDDMGGVLTTPDPFKTTKGKTNFIDLIKGIDESRHRISRASSKPGKDAKALKLQLDTLRAQVLDIARGNNGEVKDILYRDLKKEADLLSRKVNALPHGPHRLKHRTHHRDQSAHSRH